MKAIVYTKYGPSEVVQLIVVEKPIPNDNEVLIKVFASTVNRTDSGFGVQRILFHDFGVEY